MQKASFLSPILATCLLALSVYTVYTNKENDKKIEALQKLVLEQQYNMPENKPKQEESHEEHGEFPLGEYMGRLLSYTHKLGLAGKYQNWDLAGFYVHELEETIEFLADSNITDDGIEVSKLIKNLEPLVEQVEKSVKDKNAVDFPATYQTLIRNCNNCHISVNKPFIVVEAPQKDIDGQKFKK